MEGRKANILDRFSLQGKVVVIAGGKGMYGKQVAEAIAEAGAATYIASRSLPELERIAAEHRDAGHNVTALPLDLGDERSILQLRDIVMEREGKIDVLVNNAVARPMKSWDADASAFAESMKINATGLFLLTRAFGDEMAKAGGGSIVNIGSIHGMIAPDTTLYEGTPFTGFIPDYFFHKAGMINFTRFTASYYGKHNIRCNCISPGGFRTEAHTDVFVKRYSDRTFLGRMANNSDVMGAIVFFASDASLYVTGTNLPVDGGYVAK
ncbi:MAG: SDR family oxidoreductase [Paenibacillaceae bacterium]|nr:SDR family oxidoreductase [Paenibacillaceae bacterium]